MKVLVADDELTSRRLLEASLTRWGYEVVTAADGNEAARILLSPDAPKLAILDWLMPGIEGAQLCREIRRNKVEPYTYIVLLTGLRGQGDVIEGLDAGADDYIRKPFDPAELQVRLRTGKRILYLQDQLIAAREALRDRATRDQLTGLWNRAAILDLLGNEIQRTKREAGSLGVAIADLDFFKQINDTFGHQAGDEVLQAVSLAMNKAVRRYDSIGRYGGEEFLIVLPGCDETNSVSHAERLRAAVQRVVVQREKPIRTSVSLGVAVLNRNSNWDAFELIEAADHALYRAKKEGRNRVEFAVPATVQTTGSLLHSGL